MTSTVWTDPNSAPVKATNLRLVDDNTAVVITLDTNQNNILQNQIKTTVVVENVQSASGETIAKTQKEFTFVDNEAPLLDRISTNGNRVVNVHFSEPVTNASAINPENYRINGNSLHTIGLAQSISYSAANLRATITFVSALPEGDHTLRVSQSNNIRDLQEFRLLQTEMNFTIVNDTTVGKIESVIVDKDKEYIELVFSKPMARIVDFSQPANPTDNGAIRISPAGSAAVNVFNNNFGLSIVGGKLRIAAGTNPAEFNTLVAGGTHAVNVYNATSPTRWVEDAYGIRYAQSSLSYHIQEDTTKVQVVNVNHATATAVDVTFSKRVTPVTAENQFNYTLKDANGATIAVNGASIRSGLGGKVVRLTIASGYAMGEAELSIAGVRCTSANLLMDSHTGKFNLGEKVGPTAQSAVKGGDRVIFVNFNKNVDSETATNAANYKWRNANLPSGTTVTLEAASVVKIELPLGTSPLVIAGQAFQTSGAVKDIYGNLGPEFGSSTPITDAGATVSIKSWGTPNHSVRVTARDTMQFKVNTELKTVNVSDFTVQGSNPTSASFVNSNGEATVTLKWSTNVFNHAGTWAAGGAADLEISGVATQAIDGRTLVNATTGSWDYVAPALIATNPVKTKDANGDGQIDHIIIEFQENLDAAYINNSSVTVAGYTVQSVRTTDNPAGITAADGSVGTFGNNTQFIAVRVAQKSTTDTSATPAVSFHGIIKDVRGNNFSIPASATIAKNDVAPRATSVSLVSAALNNNVVRIVFTEPVYIETALAADNTDLEFLVNGVARGNSTVAVRTVANATNTIDVVLDGAAITPSQAISAQVKATAKIKDIAGNNVAATTVVSGTGVVLGNTVETFAGDPGTVQIQELTVNTAPDTGGTAVIGGVNVALLGTDNAAAAATKIAAETYAGWNVAVKAGAGNEHIVVFTATAPDANVAAITVVHGGTNIAAAVNNDVQTGAAPVAEVGTTTVTAGASASGNIVINVSDGTMNQDVTVAVAQGDSAADVAGKIRTALAANAVVTHATTGYVISGACILAI